MIEQALSLIKKNGFLVCLGDFKAVTGTDWYDSHSVVGPFSSGVANDNTERLVSFCVANGLAYAVHGI